jgi:branched-chain amino acid aminotransferase
MHRFLLHNGVIRDTADKLASAGQVGLLNGWGVFSTLRVKEGVLFAWERHYARMKKDADLMHVPFPTDGDALRDDLLKLVDANSAQEGTLRVAVVRNRGGMFEGPGIDRPYDVIAFTKDLNVWGPAVRLMTKPDARHGASPFSGTKITSWSMNLTWLEEAQSKGFDEMLLLDEHGHVSECTSANLFIVQGSKVWTPPLSCGCLPGITRAVMLEEVRAPGIELGERPIQLEELDQADDVFITSSTRDALAVSEVDSKKMRLNSAVREKLVSALRVVLESYVLQNRRRTVSPATSHIA